jgi:hypothetical protein
VVGLYGDPTVSWSILLEARLSKPADPEAVRSRLADATERFPHLGEPPSVRLIESPEWSVVRADFADQPYRDSEPLVRVAVGANRLLVAAHHGAVDGFGLLALIGIALDTPVSSSARGIGRRPAACGFLISTALRLTEALFAPPARAATPDSYLPSGRTGTALTSVDLPVSRIGSVTLTAATTRAVRMWNHRHGAATPRVVAALGASRRPGDALAPDRCTAFYRLRVPFGAEPATVRRILEQSAPEPDFPATASSVARPVIRALANRLGATFLVSNLGVVRTSPLIRSLAFHPAASGRSGIAVGAVTCGENTTVTVGARRSSFDQAAADEILRLIIEGF